MARVARRGAARGRHAPEAVVWRFPQRSEDASERLGVEEDDDLQRALAASRLSAEAEADNLRRPSDLSCAAARERDELEQVLALSRQAPSAAAQEAKALEFAMQLSLASTAASAEPGRSARGVLDKVCTPRPPCLYGSQCFRKKEEHLKRYAHPGDHDYELALQTQPATAPATCPPSIAASIVECDPAAHANAAASAALGSFSEDMVCSHEVERAILATMVDAPVADAVAAAGDSLCQSIINSVRPEGHFENSGAASDDEEDEWEIVEWSR